MEKKAVFIKRYPSKGELPNENEAYYITNLGRLKFDVYESVFRCPLLEDSYPDIDWWLEEIELPSDEEIDKSGDDFACPHIDSAFAFNCFMHGANFILNKLKGENK